MISPSAKALSSRVFLSLVAGALATLLFHQTTLQVLYWCGVVARPAFRMAVVPPFNMPMVVSVTFWGAIFGVIVGFLPRLPGGTVVRGIAAGLFALLMAWFVVRPLAGHAAAFGWQIKPMAISALANLMWGFGVVLIHPLLSPRCLLERSRVWARHHLAT